MNEEEITIRQGYDSPMSSIFIIFKRILHVPGDSYEWLIYKSYIENKRRSKVLYKGYIG